MVDFLRDFIKVLRSSDVRVSSSETIDAMKISSIIGIEDKTLLKESLSQSLAKSMREKEIFADCFDNFFKEDFMNIDNSSKEEINKNNIADKISDIQSNNDLEALFKSSDRTALMTSLAQASDEVGLKDIKLFTQTGMFTRKILESMGLEKLNNDIFQASKEGNNEREENLKEVRERIRLEIRDYVEHQLKLRTSESGKQLREDALSQVRLSQVDKSDFALMTGIVRKMAKRLIALHSRKKRKANRGF